MRLVSYLKTYVEGPFEDDIDRIDRKLKLIAWAVMILCFTYLIYHLGA
jgi:hypothetical protein